VTIDSLFADTRSSWIAEAECRGSAIEQGHYKDFFGQGDNGKKAMCSKCPVTHECLEYAERSESFWGTWGGLDAEERRLFMNRYGSVNTARGRAAHRRALERVREGLGDHRD